MQAFITAIVQTPRGKLAVGVADNMPALWHVDNGACCSSASPVGTFSLDISTFEALIGTPMYRLVDGVSFTESVPQYAQERLLVLEAVYVRDFDHVDFRISEQTHREYNFCLRPNGSQDHEFVDSNGWKLKSKYEPELTEGGQILFVRGSTHSSDRKSMKCSPVVFSAISEAVRQYNRFHYRPEASSPPAYENAISGDNYPIGTLFKVA